MLLWLVRLRILRLRLARLRRVGRLLLLLRLLLRLLSGALHVDAAAEMRAFGNGDARRHDVAIHRPVVANVDLPEAVTLPSLRPGPRRLREDFSLDLAVRANGQHVVQIDTAFDVPLIVRSSLPLNSP
jgi:hypothetical protein